MKSSNKTSASEVRNGNITSEKAHGINNLLLDQKISAGIPSHVGFIPDGNRRWALLNDLPREVGYSHGINPGLVLFEKCKELGINETSIYCYTQNNTKRPSIQRRAFIEATVAFAFEIARRGAELLVVGDVIDRVPGLGSRAAYVKQFLRDKLPDHKKYIDKYGQDMSEIRNWKWKMTNE